MDVFDRFLQLRCTTNATRALWTVCAFNANPTGTVRNNSYSNANSFFSHHDSTGALRNIGYFGPTGTVRG
jgi:hypothetical protein